MKIAIIGLGQVAMADALALARVHDVVMTGPLPDRVEAINRGAYGLSDPALASYVQDTPLRLRAELDTARALSCADMVVLSTPLSRDPQTGAASLVELDTRIEFAARAVPHAPIVVRSAVPVGYCEGKRVDTRGGKIVYAPETGRPGHMLSDVLYPEIILIGDRHALGLRVLDVLKSATLRGEASTCCTGPTEAELTRHLAVILRVAQGGGDMDRMSLHQVLAARRMAEELCAPTPDPAVPDQDHAIPLLARMARKLGQHDDTRTITPFAGQQACIAFHDTPGATCLAQDSRRIRARLGAAGIVTHAHDTAPPPRASQALNPPAPAHVAHQAGAEAGFMPCAVT